MTPEGQVARVLAEHAYVPSGLRGVSRCACRMPFHGMPHAHRAHLAAEVVKALGLRATTRIEWRIDGPGGPSYAIAQDHPEAEKWSRRVAAMTPGRYVTSRTVTTYAPVVTDWREVES